MEIWILISGAAFSLSLNRVIPESTVAEVCTNDLHILKEAEFSLTLLPQNVVQT